MDQFFFRKICIYVQINIYASKNPFLHFIFCWWLWYHAAVCDDIMNNVIFISDATNASSHSNISHKYCCPFIWSSYCINVYLAFRRFTQIGHSIWSCMLLMNISLLRKLLKLLFVCINLCDAEALTRRRWAPSQYEDHLSRYGDYRVKYETVARPSYL